MDAAIADDFVLSSGDMHSVRDLVETAFSYVGLDFAQYVVFDPQFARPLEPIAYCGDSSKAARDLGWRPTTPFAQWVALMVDHDRDALLLGEG